jgi:hypothetical protein
VVLLRNPKAGNFPLTLLRPAAELSDSLEFERTGSTTWLCFIAFLIDSSFNFSDAISSAVGAAELVN